MTTTGNANPWGAVRGTLLGHFAFKDIKQIVGCGGLDMSRFAHLVQRTGSGGTTKDQLLSAIDEQVGEMDDSRRINFISICCEEILRRAPKVLTELERVLSRLGWKLSGTTLVPIEIFDVAELSNLPEEAHEDLLKAASKLRDGDLSGALASACGALDSVTSDLYRQRGLGDPDKASFQKRISKSISTLKVQDNLERELSEIGWSEGDSRLLSNNLTGSLNQAAYVMQKLRSAMGDVHGTKPVINALVYDSIKWSSLLLRVLEASHRR